MKLGTVLSNTEQRFEIEKPIVALGFKVEIAAAIDTTTRDNIVTSLENIADGLTLSVQYKSKNGETIRPMNAISLIALLEYAQHHEGVIILDHDKVSGKSTIKGMVPLSNSGSLSFNNDETLILNVKSSVDWGDCDVYTIENPTFGFDFNDWTTLDMPQGTKERLFPVKKYDSVMIPLSALTASTVVTFHYTNGRSVDFTKDELIMVGETVNDICYNAKGNSISGYGVYAIVDLDAVKDIEITRSSTSFFSMLAVETPIVGNLKEVQKVNGALTHTNLAKFENAIRKQNIK